MSQNTSDLKKLTPISVKMPIQLKLYSETGYHSDRGMPNRKGTQICIWGCTRKIYYDGMCIDAELTVDNEGMISHSDIWMNKVVDLEVITSENDHVQAHGRAKWYFVSENNPCKLALGVFITQMPDREKDKWNRMFASNREQ